MNKNIILCVLLTSVLFAGGDKKIIDKGIGKNTIENLSSEDGLIRNEISLNIKDIVVFETKRIKDSDIELSSRNGINNNFYSSSNTIIDLRGFQFQDNTKCNSLLSSGIFEIKNKNLDYDKNQVFFRHGRITYVVPTTLSLKGKQCFMKKTNRGDIANLSSLLLYIGEK